MQRLTIGKGRPGWARRNGAVCPLGLAVAWALALASLPGSAVAEEEASVGVSGSAMPGFSRVGLAVTPRGSLSAAADAGYANIEALVDEEQAHHRGLGSLSLGYTATEWLLLFGSLEGHYDWHSAAGERESAAEGFPSLGARGFAQSGAFAYGAELELTIPGRDAPSVTFTATTPELRLLAGYDPGKTFSFASSVGYRLDRSAEAAPDPTTLSAGDRVALGASEYDALLVGIAGAARFEPWLVYAEVSGELMLGADLPTSPMRATLGGRYRLTPAWELEARAHAGLSQRPDDPFGPELLPLEPRFGGGLGLRYTFGASDDAKPSHGPITKDSAEPGEKPPAKVEPPPARNLPSSVSGQIRDAEGQPLAEVDVHLRVADVDVHATTDVDGRFTFANVPKGKGELEASTVDYESTRVEVVVAGDGKAVVLPPTAMKLATLGAQIQGLVQTFGGEPLAATITVTPPGKKYQSGADGRFAIDVAPGRYRVEISKPGYASQTHEIVVAEKAVVVINVDLRPGK